MPMLRNRFCATVAFVVALWSMADSTDPELSPAAAAIAEMHQQKLKGEAGWSSGISMEGNGFGPSYVASFLMILACEIGDKTFFIAAIMSMRYPRMVVFCGAIGALAVMTVLSVLFGWVLPLLIPAIWTHYLSIALFLYFGVQMIREGLDSDGESELEEVQAEFEAEKKEDDPASVPLVRSLFESMLSPVFVKSFTMTFLAEWGDRSQIATIALGAQKEPFGVILGGISGHCICTGMAVVGGKFLSEYISERVVALVGGVVFVLFGLVAAYLGPGDDPTAKPEAALGTAATAAVRRLLGVEDFEVADPW